jgi:hypothetical protein
MSIRDFASFVADTSTTERASLIAVAVVLLVGLAVLMYVRRHRTGRLRSQFGDPEYAHAVKLAGNRGHAEAGLDARQERVEGFHIRPLAAGDRARFVESWHNLQARFVDSPGGAVIEADQLLSDVMSTRGYPVSEYEQRAADVSVNHPSALPSYRLAHDIALRQAQGKASTEDSRQAMIHYRTLFDELVGAPEMANANATA